MDSRTETEGTDFTQHGIYVGQMIQPGIGTLVDSRFPRCRIDVIIYRARLQRTTRTRRRLPHQLLRIGVDGRIEGIHDWKGHSGYDDAMERHTQDSELRYVSIYEVHTVCHYYDSDTVSIEKGKSHTTHICDSYPPNWRACLKSTPTDGGGEHALQFEGL